MPPVYAEWIARYEQQQLDAVTLIGVDHLSREERIPLAVRGTCRVATADMVEAFPELTRVRGHYHAPGGGMAAHWWCVALDGSIVDPTAAQFPPGGRYEPYTGADPHGKCMNCAGYVWEPLADGSTHVCSEACAADLDAYYRETLAIPPLRRGNFQ